MCSKHAIKDTLTACMSSKPARRLHVHNRAHYCSHLQAFLPTSSYNKDTHVIMSMMIRGPKILQRAGNVNKWIRDESRNLAPARFLKFVQSTCQRYKPVSKARKSGEAERGSLVSEGTRNDTPGGIDRTVCCWLALSFSAGLMNHHSIPSLPFCQPPKQAKSYEMRATLQEHIRAAAILRNRSGSVCLCLCCLPGRAADCTA